MTTMTKSTQNLFAGQPFYVGIDYHKKSWKVTILGEHYEHKTFSMNPDAKILADYLKKHFPGGSYHAVYEAGFSGFNSCRELNELGVNCLVIHPADVPTSQKERLQKTDKADSRKLARSLRSKEFKGVHIPDRTLEADRALVRQRVRIVRDIARIKIRVKSLLLQMGIEIPAVFPSSQARQWSKSYIDWLKDLTVEEESLRLVINNYVEVGLQLRKQLLQVNRQIRELSSKERYKHNYILLLSMVGIGPITAMTFLTEIGDINRFKRLDELCNFVGLVPRMDCSGDRTNTGKMVKRGRKAMKIMLIEASWVAIRKDPALMAKFNELCKTMPKNKAIIRIARKVLSRIRYILKNQEEYVLGVIK